MEPQTPGYSSDLGILLLPATLSSDEYLGQLTSNLSSVVHTALFRFSITSEMLGPDLVTRYNMGIASRSAASASRAASRG